MLAGNTGLPVNNGLADLWHVVVSVLYVCPYILLAGN